MQLLRDIVIAVLACVWLLMQWMLGWGYLLAPSFRQRMRRDFQTRSSVRRLAELLLIVAGFVIVNGAIAALLWRIFVGHLKPIHEW
jgi:threonine/homoserine/homoserine lactone efflux protein